MHSMFGGNAYSVAMIQNLSFTLFPFSAIETQLFSTPVTSLNHRNQAPLCTELRLLQATRLLARSTSGFQNASANVYI